MPALHRKSLVRHRTFMLSSIGPFDRLSVPTEVDAPLDWSNAPAMS
jgi:hypothetical protein